jgi:hypothetical protein
MTIAEESAARRIVGGVDTHKDLHVAAVVDEQDRVLATHCFATTRQGYRQQHPTSTIAAGVARTTTSTPRTLRTRPSPANAP